MKNPLLQLTDNQPYLTTKFSTLQPFTKGKKIHAYEMKITSA